MPEPSHVPTGGKIQSHSTPRVRTGWESWLAKLSMAALLFEAVSGLAITVAPFHETVQWSLLLHTVVGAITLLPLAWYCAAHWWDYRRWALSHVVLLGYVALLGLAVCAASGVVLAWQGILGTKIFPFWRQTHLVSTLVTLGGLVPHLCFVAWKAFQGETSAAARAYLWQTGGVAVLGLVAAGGLSFSYSGTQYDNQFPVDYNYLYGTNRPFAPSLAKTDTGGAFDARSLAGSQSCGTAGCHEQIVREWQPSAHRYAAMDKVFLGIQDVMAKQNGAESTRYCGGCHDPISLFSGTKNIFVENLTGLHGYQEGISCLSCHAIRETDVKGNANYTITQPREYLWQWETNGLARLARDFLIRSYPDEHSRLAKRSFKKPEYCAACHKQFIDAEVNRVGWVQLQNQYDNWANSHWNKKGDARKTVECRECHMPLVTSTDPAAGDALDYNRTPGDKKHRSHRFIAANTIIPHAQRDELPGWEEHLQLTDRWLKGDLPVPEIADKWATGPIVTVQLRVPTDVAPGEEIPLKVTMGSNKVGHDFPTGPLDIIQSWLEITVTDDQGRAVWGSGRRDSKHFIEPGTFLFKAEPVDQHGNLIDRHNLWEMVGVRYRRALFPGYSDQVQFQIPCSGAVAQHGTNAFAPRDNAFDIPAPAVPPLDAPGEYRIAVALNYRKVDQFLLNYLFGETNKLTAPVTEIARATATVKVRPKQRASVSGRSGNVAIPVTGESEAVARP